MSTAEVLINLGVPKGPMVGQALRETVALSEKGQMTLEEAARQIAPKYQGQKRDKLSMLPGPKAPLGVALNPPQSAEEAANYSAVMGNMRGMLSLPIAVAGSVMPDACPAGSGITVGGVLATADAIIPAAHSADICCSMCTTFFASDLPADQLMDHLEFSTHFGSSPRPVEEKRVASLRTATIRRSFEGISANPFLKGLEEVSLRHFATQGDGNHFASLGRLTVTRDLLNHLYETNYTVGKFLEPYEGKSVYALTTHHGSRVLGALVYKRGQEVARRMTKEIADGIPDHGVWIPFSSPEGQLYWQALDYVKEWTLNNHRAIHDTFELNAGIKFLGNLFNEHNFIWRSPHTQFGVPIIYHGKGATPAWRNQLEIIPLNMSQPILLVKGKDNKEFLGFAPHGAGRNMSRTATLKPFQTDNRGISPRDAQAVVEAQTEGLDIRWYNGKPDISESPLGYKPADKIVREIEEFDLAKVVAKIEPVGCIMAGDTYRDWRKKKRNVNQDLPERARDGVSELSDVLQDSDPTEAGRE